MEGGVPCPRQACLTASPAPRILFAFFLLFLLFFTFRVSICREALHAVCMLSPNQTASRMDATTVVSRPDGPIALW